MNYWSSKYELQVTSSVDEPEETQVTLLKGNKITTPKKGWNVLFNCDSRDNVKNAVFVDSERHHHKIFLKAIWFCYCY